MSSGRVVADNGPAGDSQMTATWINNETEDNCDMGKAFHSRVSVSPQSA